MVHVEILIGSRTDLSYLTDSRLLRALKNAGISRSVSICSAHRNAVDLSDRIDKTKGYTNAYVCAAGWSAALPGTVKALLLRYSLAPVYGIAIPSDDYPDAVDAEISILRLPPGIEVNYGGKGTEGFDSIADELCVKAQGYDPTNPDQKKLQEVVSKIKDPQFDIDLGDE